MSLWRWLGRAAYWLAWPGLFVYFRLGARTRVLVMSGDSVLLVQGWMGNGQWNLPGGGLHRGEDPAAGAVRETVEESGVQLQAAQLRPLSSERCSKNGLAYRCHFFSAKLNSQAEARKQRGEIVAVQWLPVQGITAVSHAPEVDRALELLAAAS